MKLIVVTLISLTMAACGGGGSDAPVVATKYNIDAVATNAMTKGMSFTLSAVDGVDTYSMLLSLTPTSDAMFEGALRKRYSSSLTLKLNGILVGVESFNGYYSLNPLVGIGATYSDGSYAVATGVPGYYPSVAQIGDSGSLGTLTTYSSATKTTVLSTTQSNWSMEAGPGSTAFGCVNSILRNAAGTITGTGSGCYKIDTNNNLLGLRWTLTVEGKTLVFN